MLPSQRMVGAELGEDRHHDAAHQVAPIGIVGLGEDLLKAFEGLLRSRRRPRPRSSATTLPPRRRARRRARWSAAPGRPGPRPRSRRFCPRGAGAPRQPGRAPAADVPAWSRRRCRGRARAPCAASPRRPRRRACRPGRGTTRSRNCSICGGGMAPVNSATTLPSRKRLHGRNAADLKAHREVRIAVGVHLDQLGLTGPLVDCGLERGAERPAGTAPLGPEVHDHGDFFVSARSRAPGNRSR